MPVSVMNRYDKLYIDNEPYVWDEEENRVLPARFSFRTEYRFETVLYWLHISSGYPS